MHTEKYNQPKEYPVPNIAGYPNNSPKTQTKPIRGTGAAIKGDKYSKNSQ